MRILHLSTTDLAGGAFRAAHRIHQGLTTQGQESQMLVQRKLSGDSNVIRCGRGLVASANRLRPFLERSVAYVQGGQSGTQFHPAAVPFSLVPSTVSRIQPDIVHLHWVCGGMLRIEDLARFGRPIVWTLHDMWAFTGGCHYAGDCVRYQQGCGHCPQLRRRGDNDLSQRVFLRKQAIYPQLDMQVVTPSQWLGQCVGQSTLLGHIPRSVIPYGLDLQTFRPQGAREARASLGLGDSGPVILFGAMRAASDERKGHDLLLQAVKSLASHGVRGAQLLVFGADRPARTPDPEFPVRYVGQIDDEVHLARLYSAADLMVVPSREDNLPLTALESLACGTPVVGFGVGGLVDIVDHLKTGYLATPFDPNDLARGMAWVLADANRRTQLSYAARHKAEEAYSLEACAKQYISLYESMLARSGAHA